MRLEPSVLLPVELTAQEVNQVMVSTSGVARVVGKLLYGSGPRLLEGPMDCW